jgi:hypothetical protein
MSQRLQDISFSENGDLGRAQGKNIFTEDRKDHRRGIAATTKDLVSAALGKDLFMQCALETNIAFLQEKDL